MYKFERFILSFYYTIVSFSNKTKNSIVKYPMRFIFFVFFIIFGLSSIITNHAPAATYKFTYDFLTIIFKPLLLLEDPIPSQIDILGQNIIKNINTNLKFSIPLILAFFYFAYKEQKSISSRLIKGLPPIVFCASALCTIILGYLLLTSYKMYYGNITTEFSKVYFYPLIIWISLVIISLGSLLIMINIFLKSLNINYLLITKKTLLKRKLVQQYFTKTEIDQEDCYDEINSYLEAILHSFEYSLNNKLEKTFQKEFRHWNSLLFWLMEFTPSKWSVNILSKQLFSKNPLLFGNFYRSILRSQGDLIFKLVEANKFLETEEAIEALSSLEPRKTTELYPIYFIILEEIYIKSLTIKDFPFEKMLEMLKDMTTFYDTSAEIVEETSLTGIILVYKSLLKKAVEGNNVQLVNILSYSISNLFNKSNNINNTMDINTKINNSNILLNILGSLNENLKNELVRPKSKDNIILFVLFQASLKAIELGHYGCSGQLIKRITTDYPGKVIRENFRKFVNFNGEIRDILTDKPLSSLTMNFSFNEKSLSYCMQKLGLLIYSQEKYIVHKKITFTTFFNNDRVFLDLSYIDKSYVEYTLEKIKTVGDKYGLLFLTEDSDDFFKNKIISEFISPKKVKKSYQKIKKNK